MTSRSLKGSRLTAAFTASAGPGGRRVFRERIFRELYYYRRRHPSSLACLESPEDLMRLLGHGWYFACWVRRNIMKALVTLRHNWQRHVLDRKPVSLRRRQRHREESAAGSRKGR